MASITYTIIYIVRSYGRLMSCVSWMRLQEIMRLQECMRLQQCMLLVCFWHASGLRPSALLDAVYRLAYRHACPSRPRAAARPQFTPDNRKGNRIHCASSSASLRDSDAQVRARRFSAAARPAAGAWTARRAGSRSHRSRSRRCRRHPSRPRGPAPPSPPSPAEPAHAATLRLGFLQPLALPPLPLPAGPLRRP